MKQRKARGGIQTASTLEVAAPEEPKAKKRPAAAVEEEDDEEAAKQKSIGEVRACVDSIGRWDRMKWMEA